jgi:hypothetical protein
MSVAILVLGVGLLPSGVAAAVWNYRKWYKHPLNRWRYDRYYDYDCSVAGLSLVFLLHGFGYRQSVWWWGATLVEVAFVGWLLGALAREELRNRRIRRGH